MARGQPLGQVPGECGGRRQAVEQTIRARQLIRTLRRAEGQPRQGRRHAPLQGEGYPRNYRWAHGVLIYLIVSS